MTPYWITFEDGSQACCEGHDAADAMRIAGYLSGKAAETAEEIPYPANPCIWQFEHPVSGKHPRFCIKPRECAGKRSCPQSRACTS